MKRAMLDPRSLLNIISLLVLEVVGLPRDRIMRQSIEVSGLGGNCSYSIGFVHLDLTVWPMRAAHQFHIIDSPTAYYQLLGRPWIHRHKGAPLRATNV